MIFVWLIEYEKCGEGKGDQNVGDWWPEGGVGIQSNVVAEGSLVQVATCPFVVTQILPKIGSSPILIHLRLKKTAPGRQCGRARSKMRV